MSQGALASALAGDLNSLSAKIVEGPATIYDKAMDAEYLATHIGGGNHRMFDGGHTLAGAFNAVRGASVEDGTTPCSWDDLGLSRTGGEGVWRALQDSNLRPPGS